MIPTLPQSIQRKCEALLNTPIQAAFRVSGGDINEARRLETSNGRFFLKMNHSAQAHDMFAAEAKGLNLLAKTRTLRIPQVIGYSQPKDGDTGFLLLEYIESSHRRPDFWQRLGEGLAALHRTKNVTFGLDSDNFIGSLPQYNNIYHNSSDFYIHQRLVPQVELAIESNKLNTNDLNLFEKLYQKLIDIIPQESPALIHGDLWNGNFLADENGAPVLIDPAVCFASREMDLAMSLLFGGFDETFYQAYSYAYPLLPGWQERMDLYQLYYLLVHVNLFGGGYAQSVRQVLRKFT
ncbi:MAG: fructosamine kinase family protein [Saprospiraceae bacterium]